MTHALINPGSKSKAIKKNAPASLNSFICKWHIPKLDISLVLRSFCSGIFLSKSKAYWNSIALSLYIFLSKYSPPLAFKSIAI